MACASDLVFENGQIDRGPDRRDKLREMVCVRVCGSQLLVSYGYLI